MTACVCGANCYRTMAMAQNESSVSTQYYIDSWGSEEKQQVEFIGCSQVETPNTGSLSRIEPSESRDGEG